MGIAFFLFPQRKQKKQTTETPAFVIHGPEDKLWFYLDGNQKQVGPMNYGAIVKDFAQKIITQDTYVWHESLSEWKKLKDLFISHDR